MTDCKVNLSKQTIEAGSVRLANRSGVYGRGLCAVVSTQKNINSSGVEPETAAVMVKDANKPKGRTSAYAFFILSCREEHKKKSPGTSVNFAKFSKACSERWKTLTATEKKKFEDQAKVDKDRYDREMKNYVPPKGMGKMKRKKDPNAPKRPPSAFFVFCSEHRPTVKGECPGMSIGDIAKKLAGLWAKQSPKDRTPYEQKAAALRQKYEKDVAAYRAKGGAGGGAPKRGPGRPTGSTKKAMAKANDEEEDEDEEDDEEEDEEEEDDE